MSLAERLARVERSDRVAEVQARLQRRLVESLGPRLYDTTLADQELQELVHQRLREMLADEVAPADLPEAFDAKLREYLGVEPSGVVDGLLQDVHWSDSNFGYFPTYAVGNVIGVQLWQRATSDLGDLDGQLERGELGSLREWLGEHVHRWGRVFEPAELLERVVGGPLDAEPYLGYLREKVEALQS